MFIERLAVKGFRSLADVVWEPGRLNVLIGPNGGGKTNLLKVVRLLKASALGQLGKFVQREGGMQPMVWDGSSQGIEIECKTHYGYGHCSYVLMLERMGTVYAIEHERLSAEQSRLADGNLLERMGNFASIPADNGLRKTITVPGSDETMRCVTPG